MYLANYHMSKWCHPSVHTQLGMMVVEPYYLAIKMTVLSQWLTSPLQCCTI